MQWIRWAVHRLIKCRAAASSSPMTISASAVGAN